RSRSGGFWLLILILLLILISSTDAGLGTSGVPGPRSTAPEEARPTGFSRNGCARQGSCKILVIRSLRVCRADFARIPANSHYLAVWIAQKWQKFAKNRFLGLGHGGFRFTS